MWFSTLFIFIALYFVRFILCNDASDVDVKYENLHANMQLVLDMQSHFDTKTIFIVDADDDENVRITTILISLLRKLSDRDVFSMTMNYSQLQQYEEYYRHRISQPMYVVFIHDHDQIERFRRATQPDLICYPRWLLIYSKHVDEICHRPKINYFNVEYDTRLMVKCHDDPIIREWYSIDGINIKSNDLATWDFTKRFRLVNKVGLYNRRNNLEGNVLKIATVNDSPFVTAEKGHLNGYLSSILYELSSVLNFTVDHVYREDTYGSRDHRTGKYHGVMGRLQAKEVDIGVGEFTMTKKRLEVVDFTMPIMVSKNYLFIKKPDKTILLFSSYFKVYTFFAWLGFQGMFCLSVGIVVFIQLTLKVKPTTTNHIVEILLSIWGIYCQQALPEFPTSTPTRIAYFSILTTSVILLSVYSACLISYLTLTPTIVPFNDFEDFARDSTYELIVTYNSSDYDLFMNTNDMVLKVMSKLMRKEEYLPKTMIAGFNQVCTRKVAFYATEAVKGPVTARIPCDLVYIKSGTIGSIGMVMTKDNQFKELIDFYLKKLRDHGIMSKLRLDIYNQKVTKEKKYPFVPVPITGVAPVLFIFAVGILLSLVVLAIEIFLYRWNFSRENRKIKSVSVNRIVVARNTMVAVNRYNV